MSTTMNKNEISLRKKMAVIAPEVTPREEISPILLAQTQAEFMRIGYILDDKLANHFSCERGQSLTQEVLTYLHTLKGGTKVWKPFYKGFPQEVMDLSEAELFWNAVTHYWTCGEWKPAYDHTPHIPVFEISSLEKIKSITSEQFDTIFAEILSSNGSITSYDKEVIQWFVQNYSVEDVCEIAPSTIPFKETMCLFVTSCVNSGEQRLRDFCKEQRYVKTSTDILRLATAFSAGDITLSENTPLKLKNWQKRFIFDVIEDVIKEEDVALHEGKWVKLFHALHIGAQKKLVKTNLIAQKARKGKCVSFNSKVERAIKDFDVKTARELLTQKPGMFARRLDHILRMFYVGWEVDKTINEFLTVAAEVDTKVLIQLIQHFRKRTAENERFFFIKGKESKPVTLPSHPPLSEETVLSLVNGIENVLIERFKVQANASQNKLGKVWVDPKLTKIPFPFGLRTAADALKVLTRGSRIKFDSSKPILRFFINWVGEDIDLSAAFINHDLTYNSVIAYYDLKNQFAVHSGDITHAPAPDGACEFIDVDLEKVGIINSDIRYIAMDVRVFRGEDFSNQQAIAGWMTRSKLGSKGEHFKINTVEQLVTLSTKIQCTVCLFDIWEKEVIWLDMETNAATLFPNNFYHNADKSNKLIESVLKMEKFSLYDLFRLHAQANGGTATSAEEADTVFDIEMAYKPTEVMSKWI